MKLKYIDLFSGIGGFHLAAENYSFNNKKNKFSFVMASEIDKNAIEVYSKNFNVNKNLIKNIRDIDVNDIEDFDFLFAGFPCQTFSNAGKKLGFKDETKGTLFFEIKRILEAKKPKFFLLENVKHLVQHDQGKSFEVISKVIKELGYITTDNPLIISSSILGIPQKRERVYILGINKEFMNNDKSLNSNNIKMKFNSFKKEQYPFFQNIMDNILEKNPDEFYYLSNRNEKNIIPIFDAWDEFLQKVILPKNRTLPVIWLDAFWMSIKDREKLLKDPNTQNWKKKYYFDMWALYEENSDWIPEWMIKHNVQNWSKRNRKLEWQTGITDKKRMFLREGFIQLRQSGIRVRKKELFPTLVAIVQIPLIFDQKKQDWRYLTVKEVQKLQSFVFADPKHNKFRNFSEIKKDYNISNNNVAYKQFGNAVTVSVIEKLIDYMLEEYEKYGKQQI